jgi:hypothetical protein
MKKNRNIIIVTAILAVIVLILLLTQSRSTFRRSLSDFAIDDSSTVTKIFMADKNNNTLKLTRDASGKWFVNDKFPAQRFNINLLLGTMLQMEVKAPVAVAAHDNIIRQLAVNSVKVEIYQRVYRIDIFHKLRLFPHEKLTKVYYVGNATQDNRGTFMLMEHSSEPFVTYLPGFRGFLSPRFMPKEKYWRDFTIFRKNIHEIASVKVEFPLDPELSYMVRNNHDRNVELISLYKNQDVPDFDTLKVLNFLSSFRSISYEALMNDMDRHMKDSIVASVPFHIITVTDTNGVSRSVRTFHKPTKYGETEIEGKTYPYDLDRMFALVNDGKDFALIQFFVFDPIIRPITFYLKEQKKKK